MPAKHFIEVDCQQKNHEGERICGDVFISGKVKEEERIIVVLSDGMGHGVKASVLATLTATMALNFAKEHKEPQKTAEIIMKTLPECSERRMSYSTFTIIDIKYDGEVTILEFDNPECLIIRDNKIFPLKRNLIKIDNPQNNDKKLRICTFQGQKNDRILFMTDGVTQSGLGTKNFPFGWNIENVGRFGLDMIKRYPRISGRQLATRIMNMAYKNDGFRAKDDISCGVIYLREPRELLISSGPPYEESSDPVLANTIRKFKGKKIIMGATTGEIIARHLNLKIKDGQQFDDPDLPPISFLDGIDLFTEGILTLRKTEKILTKYNNNTKLGKGAADKVVKLIMESDDIHFMIGTRINIAHQAPATKIDLEIRRTVIKRIAYLLEEKFLKKVNVKYI